jgi:hypothetical protein
MEEVLGEQQVSSCKINITAQKHLNFWSDRWITPEFLLEFLEAIFLVVTMESLLCEANFPSRQTRITVEKGSNFWSDRWIVLKVSH